MDIELLCSFQNCIRVSDQGFAGDPLAGVGGGEAIVYLVAQEAAGRGQKDDGFIAVVFTQIAHQEINAAAEGGGGGIAQLTEGCVAVDVVVYAAVNDHHIGRGVHHKGAAAEAKIVVRLFAGDGLVRQAGAADAVIIDSRQVAHCCQTVIVTTVLPVGNTDAYGNAVT